MPDALKLLVISGDRTETEIIAAAIANFSAAAQLNIISEPGQAWQWINEYAFTPVGRPDIILMNFSVPGTDYCALLKKIKQNPSLSRIPVVALVFADQNGDVAQAYNNRVNACLKKFDDKLQFGQSIRTFCEFWLRVVKFPPDNLAG